MAALVFIMEFNSWCVEETVDAHGFDNAIAFALNLGNRHDYFCARTFEDYRARVPEDESTGEIFLEVTSTLVNAVHISIKAHRLDSAHLLSGMANFGRAKLLGIGAPPFTALKRHVHESYNALSTEPRERYEPTVGRVFGEACASKEGHGAAQLQIAQDMHQPI